MKIENRTMQILKNFAMINPSMLFREGSVQATIAPQKNVLARSTFKEPFTKEFAIYELSRFLGVLSLFSDPDLEFGESKVTVKEGSRTVDYTYADPELIVIPPKDAPKVNTPEVSFRLQADNLNATMKALGVLQTTHVIVEGDGEKIFLGAGKPTDPTSDTFRIEVGTTTHTFKFAFKADSIKVLPGDYDVQISSRNISHFSGEDVEYWIMADSNYSKFGEPA